MKISLCLAFCPPTIMFQYTWQYCYSAVCVSDGSFQWIWVSCVIAVVCPMARAALVSWWRWIWIWPVLNSSSSTSCTAVWSHPAIEIRAFCWSSVWTRGSAGICWPRSSTISTASLSESLCFEPLWYPFLQFPDWPCAPCTLYSSACVQRISLQMSSNWTLLKKTG